MRPAIGAAAVRIRRVAGGVRVSRKPSKLGVYFLLACYCVGLYVNYRWYPGFFPYAVALALIYALSVSFSR